MPPDDDPPPGVPEWVVTYGDMMSLLLTFFIMLVSLSELKSDGELRAMLDAIRQTFGVVDGPAGAPGRSPAVKSLLNQLDSRGASFEGGTERHGRESDGLAGPNRPVRRIDHGREIMLGGPVPFAPFEARLSDASRRDLDVLADILARRSDRVVIRGHASRAPLPAEGPFRDKLDLSFARAQAVAEYLAARGISRPRLLVSAAGDSEPRAPTRDRAQHARNDRVDVFATNAYIASPPTASPAAP